MTLIEVTFPPEGGASDHRANGLITIQETWVRSLSGEGPLEEEMGTHSSILPWRIPWPEEPGRLQSTGAAKSWTQLSE